MKFFTELCQDDVTTSSGDVILRKSYSHVAGDARHRAIAVSILIQYSFHFIDLP